MSLNLDQVIAGKSSLTNVQIETLMLQKRVLEGDLTVREAAKMRGRYGVTAGAYHRVVGQARSKVEQALYTLLLCSRLGMLRSDDLRRLLDTVAKAPVELDAETSQQVASLVDALVRRIVMLR